MNDNSAYDYGCLCCGWMLAFGVDTATEADEAEPLATSTPTPEADGSTESVEAPKPTQISPRAAQNAMGDRREGDAGTTDGQ